ncbi:hypothetical protein GYMLUDRAFT_37069 [Collybiopsis luxurians FD-317 M1]|nr:hypothetical protein GYMLUDRAFT_37069 [Collybiopsis luxurians FD-317 M1]
MADVITPADIPLPVFLDPFLKYLSENLPPPVYSVLISFLSHGLALMSALLTLIYSLIFDSSNWNAQAILPPLIALFTAYLALVSLYRTTAWMLRTSFWFIKWGTFLAALAGGAGWILGHDGNALAGRGIANTMAGWALDMINDETNSRRRSSSSGSRQQKRPKPWESFETHRDWLYKEKKNEGASDNDIAVLMETIISGANSLVKDSTWWGFLGTQDEKEKKTSDSVSVSR